MLQQTQVERVIPKFNAFVKKFPSWKALSQASLTDVYRLWSGLGYNRRAKYLRDAARIIVEKGREIPNDPVFIESLPGVGPYMKGALLAFAFGEREAFVETNIRTAVTYHFFVDEKVVSDSDVLSVLNKCLPKKGNASRNWYAALMDYGSHLKKSGVRINNKSASYTKQKKFKGSLRELRGAILRELLTNTSTPKLLAKKNKRNLVEVASLLEQMKKEGLVVQKGNGYRLSH